MRGQLHRQFHLPEAQGISCLETTAHHLGLGNPEMQQVEEEEAPRSTLPGYTGSPHDQDGAQHIPSGVARDGVTAAEAGGGPLRQGAKCRGDGGGCEPR